MAFPPKKPMGPPPDAESSALDALIVEAPPDVVEGEEAPPKEDPQMVLDRMESDLAQLRALFPATA